MPGVTVFSCPRVVFYTKSQTIFCSFRIHCGEVDCWLHSKIWVCCAMYFPFSFEFVLILTEKDRVEIDVDKTYEEASKFWEKSEEKKQQIAACLKPHSPGFRLLLYQVFLFIDLDVRSLRGVNF